MELQISDINVDNLNPAELVYDIKGIKIYKSKDATIMIKNIQDSPKKFMVLYSEGGLND